ncbi:chromate transporter [Flavobacterium sp. LB3P45]|uniref:Chromate transporter n=1 Tax=Flavobacterium fructosi TaxID=3230416 RepID=A0ABW6HM82_9FLAO
MGIHQEQVLLFLWARLIFIVVKAPLRWYNNKTTNSIVLLPMRFQNYDNSTFIKIAIFYTEAGTFVFGSAQAIVPFLHLGVVIEKQWLTKHYFIDAVAMITPGPVVIIVRFIGYFAAFLPYYLFTIDWLHALKNSTK